MSIFEQLLMIAGSLTSAFSLVAAVLSGIGAWLSYRLARSIREELKVDETIVPGVLHNPTLSHPDHENCVIQLAIFNKSKRKAYISQVKVFDSKNREIEVTWAGAIDELGNPQNPSGLLGIVDAAWLCIRRNDGTAFRETRVEVSHSFAVLPMLLRYEMGAGWQAYFAK